jgi:SRSO17 transposase
MDKDWHADLEHWLAPFSAALRHKTQARMCPAYVAGLIGPGDRKSIQPMAARTDTVSYDQLHHFIGSSIWDAAPLEAVLVAEADKLVGGNNSWLIIDDTALPKKGSHSVGVAPFVSSWRNATSKDSLSVTFQIAPIKPETVSGRPNSFS